VIEPADAMNAAAANALLKTLEEPTPGRYLLLVTAHQARLPATIRSRCQRIAFHLPPAEVALEWLTQQGLNEKLANAALEASGGNPGLALTWAKSGRLALRDEVASQLRALQQGKSNAVDVANAWGKAEPDARRCRFDQASGVVRSGQPRARTVARPVARRTGRTRSAAGVDATDAAARLGQGGARSVVFLIGCFVQMRLALARTGEMKWLDR
jgi:hypothetical protein